MSCPSGWTAGWICSQTPESDTGACVIESMSCVCPSCVCYGNFKVFNNCDMFGLSPCASDEQVKKERVRGQGGREREHTGMFGVCLLLMSPGQSLSVQGPGWIGCIWIQEGWVAGGTPSTVQTQFVVQDMKWWTSYSGWYHGYRIYPPWVSDSPTHLFLPFSLSYRKY